MSDTPSVKKEGEPRRPSASASSNPPAEVDPETILKALFKSSGVSASVQPTEFKIKLWEGGASSGLENSYKLGDEESAGVQMLFAFAYPEIFCFLWSLPYCTIVFPLVCVLSVFIVGVSFHDFFSQENNLPLLPVMYYQAYTM